MSKTIEDGKVSVGGRLPRALRDKKLQNYEKALALLDDNTGKILKVLIDGLEAVNDQGKPDKYYRFSCATVLLKKILPDRKSNEIHDPGGKNSYSFDVVDKRQIIINLVQQLDDMDFDELKRQSEEGVFALVKDNADYYLEEDDGTATSCEEGDGVEGVREALSGGEREETAEVEGRAESDKGWGGSEQASPSGEGEESLISS
jgi:hypothetical protein